MWVLFFCCCFWGELLKRNMHKKIEINSWTIGKLKKPVCICRCEWSERLLQCLVSFPCVSTQYFYILEERILMKLTIVMLILFEVVYPKDKKLQYYLIECLKFFSNMCLHALILATTKAVPTMDKVLICFLSILLIWIFFFNLLVKFLLYICLNILWEI